MLTVGNEVCGCPLAAGLLNPSFSDHFTPGCQRAFFDWKIADPWRRGPIGGRIKTVLRASADALGSDGNRARAPHLGLFAR